MTMTVQEQTKKRRKRNTLTPEKEDAIAKGLTKVLGVSVKVKRPSQRLEAALSALDLDFGKLQTKVDAVFTIGRKEGYTDREIGGMIREKMKPHYHKNTITKVFEKYPDAKKTPSGKPFGTKNVPIDGKCTKCGKPLNEPTESTDKYKTYQDVIVAKNTIIKEKEEEITGLHKQIAQLEKELSLLRGKAQ